VLCGVREKRPRLGRWGASWATLFFGLADRWSALSHSKAFILGSDGAQVLMIYLKPHHSNEMSDCFIFFHVNINAHNLEIWNIDKSSKKKCDRDGRDVLSYKCYSMHMSFSFVIFLARKFSFTIFTRYIRLWSIALKVCNI
jgi:hypothetical protein